MKIIPKDIKEMIEKNTNPSILLYQDNNYILVIDPKHNSENYHYTAWYKKDIRSLLELRKKDIFEIKYLIKNIKYSNLVPEDCEIYIHFPPNFWRLHIHFVNKTFYDIHKNTNNQTYLVKDILSNLSKNENYYRQNVNIKANL